MSIDDLNITKLLGKETYGWVYLTFKKNEKKKYAIKIIEKSEFLENSKDMECVYNELSILKDINHPNILKIFEIREDPEKVYIIGEYYNGGTLENFLEKYQDKYNKALSEEIVQYIMRQIIEGMKYLHNKKIIYRNINLENIIINYEDENDRKNNNIMKAKIIIINFGYAQYLKKGKLTRSLYTGNLINNEPNIIFRIDKNNILYKDKKKYEKYEDYEYEYDEKADIWSLGIIFYQLLIGKNPFEAEDFVDLIDKLTKGDYFIPATLSEEAFLFLKSMLQLEPNKRPSIDLLYNHEFLRKNVNQFKKIKENSELNSTIKINIKNNN